MKKQWYETHYDEEREIDAYGVTVIEALERIVKKGTCKNLRNYSCTCCPLIHVEHSHYSASLRLAKRMLNRVKAARRDK